MVDIYELATEVRALSSWCLGRYSIFSLQRLDAICFITVVLANDLDAVIEASKLELLVQLDSKLVDFNVSWSGLGEHAFHLERDGSAEGLASGATEGEHDLVLLVVVSNHMLSHGKRDRDCGGGLALDFLLDRDAEDVNGHLVTWLLISKSESAASLPRPVGIVENFEFDDLGHARSNLENLLRLAGADGAGLFPAILVPFVSAVLHLLLEFLWVVLGPFAPLTHLVSAPLHLVLELFWVVFCPIAPFFHLLLELLHQLLEVWTSCSWGTTTFSAAFYLSDLDIFRSGLINRREVHGLKEVLGDFQGLLLQLIFYELHKCLSFEIVPLDAFLLKRGLATIVLHLLVFDCSDAGGLDSECELR